MSRFSVKSKSQSEYSIGPSERFLRQVMPGVRTKTIKYIKDQSLKNQTLTARPKISYQTDDADIMPILQKFGKTGEKPKSDNNQRKKTKIKTNDTKNQSNNSETKRTLKILDRTRRVTKFKSVEMDKIKLKGKIKNIFDLDNTTSNGADGIGEDDFNGNSQPKTTLTNNQVLDFDAKDTFEIEAIGSNSEKVTKKTIFSSRPEATAVSANRSNFVKKLSLTSVVTIVIMALIVGFLLSRLTYSTTTFNDGKTKNSLTVDFGW